MAPRVPVTVLLVALLAGAARADSVPIGRYVELPVGVDPALAYPMSGADPQRTGRSRSRVPALVPARVWSTRLPRRALVPPVLLPNGTLVVGSDRGLDALDPASGAPRWFAAIGAVRYSPVVTPAGDVLAVAGGTLWRVSGEGQAREFALPFATAGAPLVLETGTLILDGSDGLVHALALDGSLLATLEPPASVRRLRWTASLGGAAFVGASPNALTLYALRGEGARSVRVPERIATNPVVGDDALFVLGQTGTLFVYARDGALLGSVPLGQPAASDGPALGWDGALRVGLRYGEIVCFDRERKERFRRGVDGAPSPMSIDIDDTLLFVSARGTLYALDRDGELRFRLTTELHTPGRPVIASDGTIYVVGRGGVVAAFR